MTDGASSQTNIDRVRRLRTITFVALVVVSIAFAAWAAADSDGELMQDEDLVFGLADGLLVSLWCRFDGLVRGKSPSVLALAGILIFGLIGFPIYCIWSRGWRGLLLLLGFMVAIVLAGAVGAALQLLLG